MKETVASARSESGSPHDRPWLCLYADDIPSDFGQSIQSPLASFAHFAKTRPGSVALWYFNSPLTFQELDDMADALACAWEKKVGRGDRVAILNQNTPGTVVGLLAAWRLGAAVMPLSPMLTSREVFHYLKDGEPAAVLVGQVQAPALYGALTDWGGNSMVAVTDARDFLHDAERPALLEGIPSESELPAGWHRLDEMISPAGRRPGPREFFDADTALVTYTSGTTGQPKGALNSHANVAFSAEVYRRWLALCPDDVLFAAAPFSHVTGLVGHIAAAFMSGAAMVMCYRFEPATVLELLERRGCTTTIAAITAYISLLNHPSFVPSRLAALKKVFSGGAPVAPAVVDRWEAATGVYIHNAYGLTETTSPSHLVPFGRRAPVDEVTGSLSVGVPVPGTHCRVVDVESRSTLPLGGGVGELLTRGPQVVAGYWKKAEESVAAFEDGWLRTGDLARTDKEGWFYVVDRMKDMIVASGFKVWPREVEDVLHEHPTVSEAAVVGVPDSYRGESPKAFVVARQGKEVSPEDLISFCRERLAPYKVPRSVEVLAELPKTNSGKVLRRMLREKAL